MLLRKLVLGIVAQLLAVVAILFVPAGTWHWWQAWVLVALMVVGSIGSVAALYPEHKDILAERLKPPIQKQQPALDKAIVLALLVTLVGDWVFIPLDVFHLHGLLGLSPLALAVIGLGAAVVGFWIAYRTMVANAYASPAVKHDEQQRVIDTGPYAIVRHPMYAGALLVLLGMPLWLGSIAAEVAALAPITVLAIRAVFEEQFLRRELVGYREYMARVRYRLVPGVW
jgi:protein-S-isoprenylcysteine O-methyltransferase Ste14